MIRVIEASSDAPSFAQYLSFEELLFFQLQDCRTNGGFGIFGKYAEFFAESIEADFFAREAKKPVHHAKVRDGQFGVKYPFSVFDHGQYGNICYYINILVTKW